MAKTPSRGAKTRAATTRIGSKARSSAIDEMAVFDGPLGEGGETHQIADGEVATLTTSQGVRVPALLKDDHDGAKILVNDVEAGSSAGDVYGLAALKTRKKELIAHAQCEGRPSARCTVATAAFA